MPDFLTGQLWKVATGVAGLVALVLGVLLIQATIENRTIAKDKRELETRIYHPETGYVAKLQQARTNVATLEGKVTDQNTAIDKLKADGDARVAETKRQLALVEAQNRDLSAKMRKFLATAPQGATVCERVNDVDRRYLETLK